ncbi:hypothetical protein QQF64_021550 [Cirrhinus molitorella]|uniref:AAA+ ATPase domain-containing protein n=1 Tax=Cirrhinus molitorella TaxID=172907 RepID=A0ABR3L992_9TELE
MCSTSLHFTFTLSHSTDSSQILLKSPHIQTEQSTRSEPISSSLFPSSSLRDLIFSAGHRNSMASKIDQIIRESTLIENGNTARYHLQTKSGSMSQSGQYRKITFGERDKNKPHKSILMVGETGTGKTTLINAMINYMLGVKREDKVWFEITDDQSDRTSAHSQTSSVTVYGFYLQESQTDLTIIDTPGYGDTRGVQLDKEIAMSFHSLSKSEEGVHEIHAVCLVIKATENRLSDRLIYIFDAVQSLFGKDIVENIILLLTHSTGASPKDALKAVKEAKINCAVNDKNKPLYFQFDNCKLNDEEDDEEWDEENEQRLDQSWNRSFRGMTGLFKFIDTIQPKSLEMTRDVIQKRKQLEANISNLQSRVHVIELKQKELKQTQEVLEQHEKYVEKNKNFEYEVEVVYMEKVDIDPKKDGEAMSCQVCKENCHYPGCWWVKDLSWCSVMKDNYCTVCTNKCHYSKHEKEAKRYVPVTKKEKKTHENLKKEYCDKIGDGVSVVRQLEKELHNFEIEKVKLVFEAFYCVKILKIIALNVTSLFILEHVDFLIEKLKEINEPEKVKTLEKLKMKAGGGKQEAVGYTVKPNSEIN